MLTKKQQLFADKYIETLNATEAALFAGYSKKTAYAIGSENLKKLEIKKYINKSLSSKEKGVILTQDQVLSELSKLALSADKDSDKIKALELVGKRYATFKDNNIINATIENDPIQSLLEEIKDAN